MTVLSNYTAPVYIRFEFFKTYLKLKDIPQNKRIRELPVDNCDAQENATQRDAPRITIIIDSDNYDLFNTIIGKCEINTSTIFELLPIAKQYFSDYEPSDFIIRRIQQYLTNMTEKIAPLWHDITSKTDYNLVLFRKRKLPFYNIQCKEWVKINIDVHSSNGYTPNTEDTEEVAHDNNYLSWPVLPADKYKNINQIIKFVKAIKSVNLHNYAFELILRALAHPEYCHILRDHYILDILNSHLDTHRAILEYCMTYAMYILRQEETITFSKVKDSPRFMFDIDTASLWPTFPETPLSQSPYSIQLTDGIINQSIPLYLRGHRRINTLSEFRRRFRLATGGAFENINLKKLNASICGSILIPCVHRSPLEDSPIATIKPIAITRTKNAYMTDYTPEDVPFLNYLEYFYPGYVSLNNVEYEQSIAHKRDDTVMIKYENEEPITIKKISKGVDYNKLADIDISITTTSFETFQTRATLIYNQVVANCKHRGPVYMTEEYTITNVKFKIYGPGIPRPFDIFKTFSSPDKLVKMFHLGIVRMYYDGQVMMYRSCISSMLSGICESYKIHSCKKIPADIILKYLSRGISVVLNGNELKAVIAYIKTSERWNYIFDGTLDLCNTINASHQFFTSNNGIRFGLRKLHEKKQNYNMIVSNVVNKPIYTQQYGDVRARDYSSILAPNSDLIRRAVEYA